MLPLEDVLASVEAYNLCVAAMLFVWLVGLGDHSSRQGRSQGKAKALRLGQADTITVSRQVAGLTVRRGSQVEAGLGQRRLRSEEKPQVPSSNAGKDPLELIKLKALIELTSGSSDVMIGQLDGPVAFNHPDLASDSIRQAAAKMRGSCAQATSIACSHGTFTAGILCAKRDSPAPAICPGCTLLVRPIFKESSGGDRTLPSATPAELASAIVECVDAGARILNLSAGFAQPSSRGEPDLEEALTHAASRGVIVVAAAGNQGALGSSVMFRDPRTIPVVAYDLRGRPMSASNFGSSIGKRGVGAPGAGVTSLGAEGKPRTAAGTSVAVPFVTGTIALLWSLFPAASAREVRFAVTQAYGRRRRSVVPPLLDARAAYWTMANAYAGRRR
jgi:subtilisin family serine protease